jgi:hypothetical protein
VIIHVVLIAWKPWATAQQIDEVKATFEGLAAKIPGIKGAYWGASLPGGSEGFKHGVVVLADDQAALDAYHAHPDHQQLTTLIHGSASRMLGENLQA